MRAVADQTSQPLRWQLVRLCLITLILLVATTLGSAGCTQQLPSPTQESPQPATPSPQTADANTTAAAPDGSINVKVGEVTATAPPGTVAPGTELKPRSAKQRPPKKIDGLKINGVGSGISITVPKRKLSADITLRFPARPLKEGLQPAVAHLADDGDWDLRLVDWDGTTATLATRDFSPNVLVWLDPSIIANTIKNTVVEFLTGRTPSPGCRGEAHSWSHLDDDQDLAHACLTTNDSKSAGERAELRLTSNRGAYIQVDIPKGVDYVWIEDQPEVVRMAVATATGVDPARTVFLAPGEAMTIGWRKPPPEGNGTVKVTASPRAMGLSFILGGMKIIDPKIDSSTSTVVAIATQCAKEQATKLNIEDVDVTQVVVCLVGSALGNLANPNVALKIASQWLGPTAVAGELSDQTRRLTTVGEKAVKAGFIAKTLVYVQAVRTALLASWGTVSDQLQVAIARGGGTTLTVTLTLPKLSQAGIVGTWYRHGSKLTIRADGSGTMLYRTYSESEVGPDAPMVFAAAKFSHSLASDGRTVKARVTSLHYQFDDNQPAPAPETESYLQVGDTVTFRKKESTGALNQHDGSRLVISENDLAWCKEGVDDAQCGA